MVQKQKQRLIAVLLVIIAFTVIYFFAWDGIKEARDAYRALKEVQKEYQHLQLLIDDIPRLRQELERISVQAVPIFQALPVQFSESEPIAALASLASQSGVILSNVGIGEIEKEGVVSIDADIVGTVTSLERFIRALEVSFPLFELVSVSFEGALELQQFSLSLTTHILPVRGEESFAYSELRSEIEQALGVNLDVLKDPQFQQFSAPGELPVAKPSPNTIGRENPFVPF